MTTTKNGVRSVLVAALCASMPAVARDYQVRPGDTLSKIAHDQLGSPTYGDAGTLRRLIEMNPEIEDPNRIWPKQNVHLSSEPAAPEPPPAAATAESPAPAPAAPVAAATSEATSEAEGKAGIYASAGLALGDTTLHAKGKKDAFATDLHSHLGLDVALTGGYRFESGVTVGLVGDLATQSFDSTSDGRFQKSEYTLKAVGASLGYLGDRCGADVSYSLRELPFVSPAAVQKLEIKPVMIDQVMAQGHYDILSYADSGYGLLGRAAYLASGKGDGYTIAAGSSLGGEVYGFWRFGGDFAARVSLVADQVSQASDVAEQRVTTAGFKVGLDYDLH